MNPPRDEPRFPCTESFSGLVEGSGGGHHPTPLAQPRRTNQTQSVFLSQTLVGRFAIFPCTSWVRSFLEEVAHFTKVHGHHFAKLPITGPGCFRQTGLTSQRSSGHSCFFSTVGFLPSVDTSTPPTRLASVPSVPLALAAQPHVSSCGSTHLRA